MLYDLEQCEHRPWMDLHGDTERRDVVSPFVQMLWRRGRAHEEDVIAAEGVGEFLNLLTIPINNRERLTLEAMERREPLIYGGMISADDLLGKPDVLRLEAGGYVPGDIKSGAGEDGPPGPNSRLKVHYGVQLALYVDVLERIGRSAGRRGFVWDIHGEEVQYDLTVPRGPRSSSLWEAYVDDLRLARSIVAGTVDSRPAYASGTCKQCWWLEECLRQLEDADDLTLLPELGRSRRDSLARYVSTTAAFAAATIDTLVDDKGKISVRGFTRDSLFKFQSRAILSVSGGSPYLKSPITFPQHAIELFFDIETDPSRDHCYLHGFVERRNGDNASERFFGFFSKTADAVGEHAAFADAWRYVQSLRPCGIYIYSKYERTWWRSLQQRHPDVCTAEVMTALFASDEIVDLYEIVMQHTEWPTRDYSLKTLAKFLGFAWRDVHPSGAASIEWFERHLLGDRDAKGRILAYNEDDCRATRVLLDGIIGLGARDAASASA